jgi:hypothetical protein
MWSSVHVTCPVCDREFLVEMRLEAVVSPVNLITVFVSDIEHEHVCPGPASVAA